MSFASDPKRFDPQAKARRGVVELEPYIPGKPVSEVRRELGLERVVKLASNECPLPPPPAIVRAVEQAALDLCRYPDGQCWELKQAVSTKLDIPPECLLFTNGAEECIRLVALAFTDPGDRAVIPEITFDAYKTSVLLAGGEVVTAPMTGPHGLDIDLDAVLERVDERTKTVWLCTPNNPPSTCLQADTLEAFLGRLPENVLVVLDEAYCDFVTDPGAVHGLNFLLRDDRVALIRTFSKAYGLGGMRVGYLAAHPAVTRVVLQTRLPFTVNAPAQAAAAAALGEPDFVADHVAHVILEREKLSKELDSMGCEVEPSQTNFVFFRMPDSVEPDADAVFERLLRQGFIVKPGTVWGHPRHIRASIGSHQENIDFLAALRRVFTG